MADVAALFSQQLASAMRALSDEHVVIDCGGAPHRLVVHPYATEAWEHDLDAERVVAAVGGPLPACVAIGDVLSGAESADLWAAVAPGRLAGADEDATAVLRLLPPPVLARLVAQRLASEFSGASVAVAEAVARVGLRLLGDAFAFSRELASAFQVTRELPRWDTGERRWIESELVTLYRHFRAGPSAADTWVPYLVGIPRDAAARRTVAVFVSDLLEDHHLYTRADLGRRLRPVHRNSAKLVAMLVAEGVLVETSGGYRTAAPSGASSRAAR